jgi:hypothetical protein
MDDLEQSAGRALAQARDLAADTEQARAQVAASRAALREAGQRLDGGWAGLLARAQALEGAVAAAERELAAAHPVLEEALASRQATVDDLLQAAPEEARLTRQEFEDLAIRAEALGPELAAALAAAEDAEETLQQRLAQAHGEIAAAAAEVERELQVDLAADLQAFEAEVERLGAGLQAALDDCRSAVENASREMFDQLVRAEGDVRAVLEAAADGAARAAEGAQEDCGRGHEETLAGLEHESQALADTLSALEAWLGRGHDELESTHDACAQAFRDTGQALRDTRQAVREVEEMLARFSFVRL